MTNNLEAKRYISPSSNKDTLAASSIDAKKQKVEFIATSDFLLSDPWSEHMRTILQARAAVFSEKPLLEFGIGDARNPITIMHALQADGLPVPTKIIGIDIETWKLDLADHNLQQQGILWYGDAYAWVNQVSTDTPVTGNAILCLPQAPFVASEGEDQTVADVYQTLYLPPSAQAWNKFGLGLNAAVLEELAKKSDTDFTTFAMFSGRVPEDILDTMLQQVGWEIKGKYKTPKPIQQDPDTPIGYTIPIDNGQLFYEQLADGLFSPISAVMAESRRDQSHKSGKDRSDLNVYHHLTVYELSPLRAPIITS